MIGVFDSGVGGLSVVKHLIKRFKSDIVYLGDTARLPYGTKSAQTVVKYALQNARFLTNIGVDAIVVACNTASSVALDAIKEAFELPVFGVIEPAAKKAAQFGSVCVIGTTSTINSNAYKRKIELFNNKCEVRQKACPLFVPLVEEGLIDHEITYLAANYYLKGIRCDAMILGCTHYPLLKGVIKSVMGDTVLIDCGESLAESLDEYEDIFKGSLKLSFYTTDSEKKFAILGRMFLGEDFNSVKLVDLG
ncbi:glutamate racemase [Hippea jasoniae]|uniref:glutamate racemase n=1 Tax=Hippea jasoniae TaxID=944479 RepID=UPI0005556391|nr:glutamate racemase [Hippea jasoniae]